MVGSLSVVILSQFATDHVNRFTKFHELSKLLVNSDSVVLVGLYKSLCPYKQPDKLRIPIMITSMSEEYLPLKILSARIDNL